jgi:hypothetical protein
MLFVKSLMPVSLSMARIEPALDHHGLAASGSSHFGRREEFAPTRCPCGPIERRMNVLEDRK